MISRYLRSTQGRLFLLSQRQIPVVRHREREQRR
jgi:hypothetical protein